jgi:hypothetical protein
MAATSQHQIRFAGPAVGRDRVSAPLLSDLLRILVDGAEEILRYRLEGRSRAKGTKPAWLRAAADFQFLPTTDPSVVKLEASPLRQVLPDRFKQRDFFETIDPEKSALDLFEDGLEDALRGNADSDLFDEGLASTFAEFAGLYRSGLDFLEIVNGRTVAVTTDGLTRVEALRRQTPLPRSVRVAGELDSIRYSDRMFELVLPTGEKLRGVAEDVEGDALATLWGKPVVVAGAAVFRPSGSLLRVEARAFSPATEADLAIWGSSPHPLGSQAEAKSLHVPQGPRTGLHALLGKWPGDEDDEAIRRGLEAVS